VQKSDELRVEKQVLYSKQLKACYRCVCEFRLIDSDTAMGIGRVMQPEKFPEGMYQLFFLTSMRQSFRKNVIESLRGNEAADDAENQVLLPEQRGETSSEEYLFQVLALAICQFILLLVLAGAIDTTVKDVPISLQLFACKFICGYALHLMVSDNELNGLMMLKHTINHPYKFNNYALVCFAALVQASVGYMCEILNYLYILNTDQVLDIITNFVAFYIISELDEIYFKVIGPTTIKRELGEEVVEVLTRRHRTTSKEAMQAYD
jgi:hypothetical protein